MVNRKRSNLQKRHNETITHEPDVGRPLILIPTTHEDAEGFALLMSEEGPRRVPADVEGKKFFAAWGIEMWQPVKKFTVVALSEQRDVDRFRGLASLRRAIEESAPDRAREALESAAKLLIDDALLRPVFRRADPRKAAAIFYPAFFSGEMRGTSVVLWRTNAGEFLPGILCPSARTAAFVAAAFRVLSVCPNCHKIFDPYGEHPDGSRGHVYCTIACGSRYRQKMYRQKMTKPKKSTKRGGRRK